MARRSWTSRGCSWTSPTNYEITASSEKYSWKGCVLSLFMCVQSAGQIKKPEETPVSRVPEKQTLVRSPRGDSLCPRRAPFRSPSRPFCPAAKRRPEPALGSKLLALPRHAVLRIAPGQRHVGSLFDLRLGVGHRAAEAGLGGQNAVISRQPWRRLNGAPEVRSVGRGLESQTQEAKAVSYGATETAPSPRPCDPAALRRAASRHRCGCLRRSRHARSLGPRVRTAKRVRHPG